MDANGQVYDSKFRRPLPLIVYWRQRNGGVLTSVFGPVADLAEARDKDGCMAQHLACRRGRPLGVTGWRLSPDQPWQSMETCPVPEDAPDGRQGGVEGKPQQSKYGR